MQLQRLLSEPSGDDHGSTPRALSLSALLARKASLGPTLHIPEMMHLRSAVNTLVKNIPLLAQHVAEVWHQTILTIRGLTANAECHLRERLVKDGGQVLSEIRQYARQARRMIETQSMRTWNLTPQIQWLISWKRFVWESIQTRLMWHPPLQTRLDQLPLRQALLDQTQCGIHHYG